MDEPKIEKKMREKIKDDFETRIELGKPRFYSVDVQDFWCKVVHRVATEDAIRLFCDCIGNTNPLYRSRDYAKNGVYGDIIAPPSFLNAVSTFNWLGVPGLKTLDYKVTGVDAGFDVEWFKTIRLNDEFRVVEIPTKVIDMSKGDKGARYLVCADKIYKNQRDEAVAVVHANIMYIVADDADNIEEIRLKEPKPCRLSEQGVEEWFHLMEQEEIRGANPRFWEDVKVGDHIPSTHHVFTLMENVAFVIGVARRSSWRFAMLHRSSSPWERQFDPESGLPDFGGVHMTDASAQRLGLPRASARAVQLHCWLCTMITNWMGDSGFLKKTAFQLRRPLYRESLALCKGEVAKKHVEGDEHLVDLKITLEDHNGDFPIPNGSATVALPSRRMDNWRS